MKKLYRLVALILCLLMLTGCAGAPAATQPTETQAATQETEPQETDPTGSQPPIQDLIPTEPGETLPTEPGQTAPTGSQPPVDVTGPTDPNAPTGTQPPIPGDGPTAPSSQPPADRPGDPGTPTAPLPPQDNGPTDPTAPGDQPPVDRPTDPEPTASGGSMTTIPPWTQPNPTDPPATEAPTEPVQPTLPELDPGDDQELALYQQLFDKNNRIDIDIDMSDAELRKLQKDFEQNRKSPIYRKADVTITVTTAQGSTTYTIEEVGVRMKGNTSRTDFYNENDGIYNYIHLKLDFQETFDDEERYGSEAKVWSSKEARKARKNRTFATLEKLELRWNKCADSTYLREGYAYDLYREQGVPAPRTNLASLDWAGLHMGVYSINEPVDEVFLSKNLPAEDLGGDLYKLGWTYMGATFTSLESIGIENEMKGEFYVYDLKTNKKTSRHESLKALITGLSGTTKEGFAQLVDVDRFLSYAAVSYFLGCPDDLRNNYNNCYLYFLKSSGKAIIIPYDFDRCLGITYEYNPTGNGLTEDDPFTDKTGASGFNDRQKNPLFNYSVVKGGYYVQEYAQVLERVAGSELLKPETFEALFNTAKSIYSGDVEPGKDLHNDGGRDLSFSLDNREVGNMSFRTYITKKMATYQRFAGKVDENVGGQPQQPSTDGEYYIRGDFNGWTDQEAYKMTKEGSLWVFRISRNQWFKMKVYDAASGSWYGCETFDGSTTVPYTAGGQGSIGLEAGSYLITFDPLRRVVTVTAE